MPSKPIGHVRAVGQILRVFRRVQRIRYLDFWGLIGAGYDVGRARPVNLGLIRRWLKKLQEDGTLILQNGMLIADQAKVKHLRKFASAPRV
jgi:hypothetical protein